MTDAKCEFVDVEQWEVRLESILRGNNKKLVEQIELVLASYVGQNNLTTLMHKTIESEEAIGMDDSIPNEFCSWKLEQKVSPGGSAMTSSEHEEGRTIDSNESPGNDEVVHKANRLSIASLSSGDERSFRENLVKSQKKANRKAYGRASAVPYRNSMVDHVKRIVSSWIFEAFFATAILSNSLLIGVQVHYAAQSIGKPLPPVFFIAEQVYALLFLVELVMRILAEGMPSFFWSSPNVVWNYLDVLIILTSVLNLVSEVASMNTDADALMSGNVRIIRILRVTRVIRVVRVVKIVRFIRALRSLVHSIFGTMKVLMWSVMLLLMIIYVFAIVFTDVSTEYISNFEISQTDTAFLQKRFQDLERSMQTLFQSISNGVTWGDVADKLHNLNWVWGYLYVIYVAFCAFCVLNVMTGVFCQSAIESAERDQELHVQSIVTSKQQQIDMFMSVFESLQKDRGEVASGNVTYLEFEELFNEPHIKSFFQSLDVETHDAWTLFKLMDTSGNGDLDATEFVEGCMRLKGPARSIDVSLLMQENKRVRKKLISLEQLLQEVHVFFRPKDQHDPNLTSVSRLQSDKTDKSQASSVS
ncbi:unnamed protein product [Durusdinium trenchii]|uniref:EF-hand domain-containing protein n=1 Tax=Durusdinium trenchii TaxID=1381693 RepID=A0ABP0QWE9_9DINO